MDIKEIRRKNLLLLIDEFKTQAALSDVSDISVAYINQIVTKRQNTNGTPRGMGHKTARQLEEKCKKTSGWMDVLHDESGGEYVYIKNPLLLRLLQVAEKAPPEVVAEHTRGIDSTTQLILRASKDTKPNGTQ